MKKVVVVANEQVLFEGKNLKVINRDLSVGHTGKEPLLIVMDGEEELGVFQTWLYWKKLE